MTTKDKTTVLLMAALCLAIGFSFGTRHSYVLAIEAACYALAVGSLGFMWGATLQGELVEAQRQWIEETRRLWNELKDLAVAKRKVDMDGGD